MPKKIIRNLQIGVIISLILLVASSIASYISIHKQVENRENFLKSKESISLAKDILNTLLDAETGNRGYQLTGRENFLEPFNESKNEYPLFVSRKDKLNVKDKDQINILNELLHTSEMLMKEYVLLIENRKKGILMSPEELVQNKEAMDRCRMLVQKFVKLEEVQLAIKNDDLNRSSKWTVLFIIFSAVAAIGVTIFVYIQLKSDLIRRGKLENDLFYTKEMLEETGSVAQGEVGKPIWRPESSSGLKVQEKFTK